MKRVALAVWIALGSAACATAPEPGEPDYPFNLDGAFAGALSLGDSVYAVEAEIRTAADGTLRGTLTSTGSTAVLGDVSGTIRADSLLWRSSWVMPDTGCSGVLVGWGGIFDGGVGAEGPLRSEGSCAATNGSGSFRFMR